MVTKVHKEAERHNKNGYKIILIGHKNHPEVIGTMGQITEGKIILVENIEDANKLNLSGPIAYVTQTTLSVDDTKDIIDVLKKKFPDIKGPIKEDICYATTNRQNAVKEIAPRVDVFLIIGAENSSNCNRLREVAIGKGVPAYLINSLHEFNQNENQAYNICPKVYQL